MASAADADARAHKTTRYDFFFIDSLQLQKILSLYWHPLSRKVV
jgi:hypothetical protein